MICSTHICLAGDGKRGSAGEASGGWAAGHRAGHHGGNPGGGWRTAGAGGGWEGGRGRRRAGLTARAIVSLGRTPQGAGLDLDIGLTFTVDHLFNLGMILLNVIEVVLVIQAVVVVVLHAAPITPDRAQKLHLLSQSLQLTPQLPVLLLELSHGPAQRPALIGRLLQTPLHAQLKGTDVQVDLSDGIPERVLITGESRAHSLPLRRGRALLTKISHLGQRRCLHEFFCLHWTRHNLSV